MLVQDVEIVVRSESQRFLEITEKLQIAIDPSKYSNKSCFSYVFIELYFRMHFSHIFPHSDQRSSKYGHFSCSENVAIWYSCVRNYRGSHFDGLRKNYREEHLIILRVLPTNLPPPYETGIIYLTSGFSRLLSPLKLSTEE